MPLIQCKMKIIVWIIYQVLQSVKHMRRGSKTVLEMTKANDCQQTPEMDLHSYLLLRQ